MVCPIDWCAFTWETAATFATGGAAVIGAVVIGWRQAGIMDTQTKILGSQNNVERLRLKSELFERRYRVFVEFGVFLDAVIAGQSLVPLEIEGTRQNVERSIFLFDRSIYEHISPLFEMGLQQTRSPDPARAATLQTARINLHQAFERWLKLDDSVL